MNWFGTNKPEASLEKTPGLPNPTQVLYQITDIDTERP